MKKNSLVLEYCDIGKPYLKISYCEEDGHEKILDLVDFSEHHLGDDVAADAIYIAEMIKNQVEDYARIELVLSLSETFKKSFFIPQMNVLKAISLNKKEIKKDSAELSSYTVVTKYFKQDLGFSFSNYYIPNITISVFAKAAKILHKKIRDITVTGERLALTLGYKVGYTYFYIRRGACTILLSLGSNVITSFDFAFVDTTDIFRKYISIISKYELRHKAKPIEFYAVDSDIPFDIDVGLKSLDCYSGPIDDKSENIEFKPPHKKGFSIIEVIVALLLFSVFLITLCSAVVGLKNALIRQSEYVYFDNICREIAKYGDRYGKNWDVEYFGADAVDKVDGVEHKICFDSDFNTAGSSSSDYTLTYKYVDGELILSVENTAKSYKIIENLNYGGGRYE